ncbi:MAG: flagellar hook-length control protein FliK, partial [Planctomycetota bacterium]
MAQHLPSQLPNLLAPRPNPAQALRPRPTALLEQTDRSSFRDLLSDLAREPQRTPKSDRLSESSSRAKRDRAAADKQSRKDKSNAASDELAAPAASRDQAKARDAAAIDRQSDDRTDHPADHLADHLADAASHDAEQSDDARAQESAQQNAQGQARDDAADGAERRAENGSEGAVGGVGGDGAANRGESADNSGFSPRNSTSSSAAQVASAAGTFGQNFDAASVGAVGFNASAASNANASVTASSTPSANASAAVDGAQPMDQATRNAATSSASASASDSSPSSTAPSSRANGSSARDAGEKSANANANANKGETGPLARLLESAQAVQRAQQGSQLGSQQAAQPDAVAGRLAEVEGSIARSSVAKRVNDATVVIDGLPATNADAATGAMSAFALQPVAASSGASAGAFGAIDAGIAGDAPAADLAAATEPDLHPCAQLAAKGVALLANQRGGAITMRLEPPALGQLRIELHINQGAVVADFTAATPEARILLEANLGMLRERLESQGLSVERISVHGGRAAESVASATNFGASDGRSDGADARNDGRDRSDRSGTGQDAAGSESRGRRDSDARAGRDRMDAGRRGTTRGFAGVLDGVTAQRTDPKRRVG